jgi:long-chain acyl-CoA synthetase
LGTVGRAMPPARVRIDPPSGEVQVAGPTVFQGYWRDPAATAAAFTDDGWYHTGDVGRWDAHGNLILSGRLKDMIALPNGMKVYPEDIENALRVAGLRDTVVVETAPGRIEAVVLPPGAPALAPGAPTPPAPPRSAEEVAALRATVEAAVKTANASLGMHQRVVAWRFWPEPDFPRTHTLKVRRDAVRAWVQTEPPPSKVAAAAPTS